MLYILRMGYLNFVWQMLRTIHSIHVDHLCMRNVAPKDSKSGFSHETSGKACDQSQRFPRRQPAIQSNASPRKRNAWISMTSNVRP